MFLLSSTVAYGATYYVRTDGNNANAGTTNSAAGAWRTIDWAADHVGAGDTVRAQNGTYPEVVTAGAPWVARKPHHLRGRWGRHKLRLGHQRRLHSSRRVHRRRWTQSADGFYLQNADYVELWHNTIQNFENDSIRTDSGGRQFQSNNCIFIGNVIKYSGYKDFQVRGNNNVIAYNESAYPEIDFIYLFGQRNRLLNNYSHNVNADPSSHTDFIQSGSDSSLGLGHSLYEANFYADESGSDHHCTNIETNSASLGDYTIFRRNVWSSNGNAGGQCYGMSNTFDYVKIYNETVAYTSQYGTAIFGSGGGVGRAVMNNVWYSAWYAGTSIINVLDDVPDAHDYNLYFDPSRSMSYTGMITGEPHSLRNANPLMTNAAARDFTVQSGSPVRNAGGPLTTVTSGNNTGNTFTVGDASYFSDDDGTISQYGGSLVVGDTITVGTDVVTVVSISGNAVTVTPSFTWANGDPVYFGNDSTPDIGALPYKATYNLSASYAQSGSSVTVLPSDSSLVRFVVCFDDGVPTSVDNSSPYTCSAGQGSFSAKVYPLYASKTLFVNATQGGAPPPTSGQTPPAPTGLTIVPAQ